MRIDPRRTNGRRRNFLIGTGRRRASMMAVTSISRRTNSSGTPKRFCAGYSMRIVFPTMKEWHRVKVWTPRSEEGSGVPADKILGEADGDEIGRRRGGPLTVGRAGVSVRASTFGGCAA